MEKFDNKKIIISAGVLLIALVAVFVAVNFRTYTVTFDSKMGTSIQAQEVKNAGPDTASGCNRSCCFTREGDSW